MTGTLSDLGTRTMTPDQMNVEALLQSRDYFASTQSPSELEATGDLSERPAHSFDGTLDSQSQTQRKSADFYFGRYSMGTTSDMSLPAGLTRTLEDTGGLRGSERFTYTVESDSDFRQSAKYQNGLEGMGDFEQTMGSSGNQLQQPRVTQDGPRQVSVTIPSVAEEDSESGDFDVSEISLGGN